MKRILTSVSLGFLITATTVFAASHAGPFDGAITARKSHMKLYAHNLGILGGMAKGALEYDAASASTAAANLAVLASMSQASYWPAGSDSFDNQNTRALPEIWQNFPDVAKQGAALVEASAAMAGAAGEGIDALRAAMGPVGGACGACHKAYRKPE